MPPTTLYLSPIDLSNTLVYEILVLYFSLFNAFFMFPLLYLKLVFAGSSFVLMDSFVI